MTLRERGFTGCDHPAMRMRANRTRPNCEMCGAIKTARGWRGGSIDFVFDPKTINQRHGARIRARWAH